MRPTAKPQGALRAPLNAILGTESSVRILRALSMATVPLSRSDIAREASLHPSGIPHVLDELENIGVVERIGRARSQPVRLRDRYPLTAPLRQLFELEAQRAAEVERKITWHIQSANPPEAAWIEPPVATHRDAPSDPITVGVLAPKGANDAWAQQLRHGLNQIQAEQDVAIELRVRTRADILTASDREREALRGVRPLIGAPPLDLLGLASAESDAPRRSVSHGARDSETLSYARAIATKLRSKPDLVDEAIRFIDRRVHTASASEALALNEWRDILTTYSPGRLRTFLVSDSAQAMRLRQSMPFAGALTDKERGRARRKE